MSDASSAHGSNPHAMDEQLPIGEVLRHASTLDTHADTIDRVATVDGRRVYWALAYDATSTDLHGTRMTPDAFVGSAEKLEFPILTFHNKASFPVGKPVATSFDTRGLSVGFVFADTPDAKMAEQLVAGGFLRGVSVGFVPTDGYVDKTDNAPVFTRAELVELSLTPTPSSRKALIDLTRSIGEDADNVADAFGLSFADPEEEDPFADEVRAPGDTVIVADMDGTISTEAGVAIEPVIAYLRDANANGVKVVIVSGRPDTRLDETVAWLSENDVPHSQVHLSDFPVGPNASREFKLYKAGLLLEQNYNITEWLDDDSETRNALRELGINATDPEDITGDEMTDDARKASAVSVLRDLGVDEAILSLLDERAAEVPTTEPKQAATLDDARERRMRNLALMRRHRR